MADNDLTFNRYHNSLSKIAVTIKTYDYLTIVVTNKNWKKLFHSSS